jgi:lipopolysaccharide transport system permease protein
VTDLGTTPITVLEPSSGGFVPALRELWRYRELLYFFVWRDVTLRYRQTALGVAWAVIQPMAATLVFTLVFGRLARLSSDGVPYALFSFVGLLPWTFAAHAVGGAAQSVVGNAHLVTKVYFPRLIVPCAAVITGLPDLGAGFAVLLALLAWYGIVPGVAVVLLPAFVLLALVAALGVGVWLAALNVAYRDVRYVVPFLLQLWLFATPVVYPASLLPEPWRPLAGLNPMAGAVEGFRWALLGTPRPTALVGISVVVALVVLITGLLYFLRVEETFADVV